MLGNQHLDYIPESLYSRFFVKETNVEIILIELYFCLPTVSFVVCQVCIADFIICAFVDRKCEL